MAPLPGRVGGQRVWFAPELEYNWQGAPDWVDFSNYEVPDSLDPGAYKISEAPSGVTISGAVQTASRQSGRYVQLDVTKTLALATAPEAEDYPALQAVRLRTAIGGELVQADPEAVIDLWSIYQLPPGLHFFAPLNPGVVDPVTTYSSTRGTWTTLPEGVAWLFTGLEKKKFGVGCQSLRQDVYAAGTLDENAGIVYRFLCGPGTAGDYCDHPFGIPKEDQFLQVWDGMGFGEVEFHSAALGERFARRTVEYNVELDIFAGPHSALSDLVQATLSEPDSGHVLEAFERG